MVLIYEEHNAFRLWVAASGGHRHGSHHIPWCNTRQSRWGTISQCVVRRTIVWDERQYLEGERRGWEIGPYFQIAF